MKLYIQSVLLSFFAFVCLSWLCLKTMTLYREVVALRRTKLEQLWPLQQCVASYENASKFLDCDQAFRIANATAWDIVHTVDHVQAFFVFPALVCCVLWAAVALRLLYK